MKKEEWQKIIKSACEEAGTYRPFFDPVIDSLAGIMDRRDNAQEKFIASGGETVVAHTNKGGSTNIVKHPALVVLMDCDRDALAYWDRLGLTPAGYKKLNAEVVKEEKQGGFERLLEKVLDD